MKLAKPQDRWAYEHATRRLASKMSATAGLLFVGWLLVASSLAASPQGYRVAGIVRDQTGGVVPEAEVTFQSGSSLQTRVTDQQGRFEFDRVPAAAGTVVVKAQGFAPLEKKWFASQGEAVPMEIVIFPASLAQQLTVIATRAEVPLGDTPASVAYISQDELKATAALTLDDGLRQVPGFTLFRRSGSRTSNPTSQGFSLRGIGASGASRGLVLADGIPLNDPFGGWVYWNRIPRESVNAVEILSGAASDLYGSDAMGGVINVITRRPASSSFSFQTSYGNEQTPDLSMAGSVRAGKWMGLASGEAFHTDGFILIDEQHRGRVDTRAGSEYSTLNLDLTRAVSDRARIFIGSSIFAESRENGKMLERNRTHLRQLSTGADWQSPSAGAFSARIYGGPQVFDQNFFAVAADRNSEMLTRVQRVPARDWGGSAHWSRAAGVKQTLVAGFETRAVRGASDELVFVKEKVTSAVGAGGRERTEGFYAEDIIRPASRWIVTAGGRIDHWRNYNALSATRPVSIPGPMAVTTFPDRTETAFSPRLSVLFKASENVSLVASGYRAFRAPTLNELYRSFRLGNVVTLANPDLLAERLTGGEAGARYAAFSHRVDFRGTYFWSEVSRPISNVTLAATPTLITRKRENLGRTRGRGIELTADARLSAHVAFSAGYQFVDATILSFPGNESLVGLQIPQVPRNAFTFQARYAKPRVVTLAAQGRFGGAQFDDDQNLLRLDRYFTLDALASRTLGNGVELFAAGENLSGQRYVVGRTPIETLGPPILFRVGLRFTVSRH